jgi:hypothetical protein
MQPGRPTINVWRAINAGLLSMLRKSYVNRDDPDMHDALWTNLTLLTRSGMAL